MDNNHLRREQQMRNDPQRNTPHSTLETWQIEREKAFGGDVADPAQADVRDVAGKRGGLFGWVRRLFGGK